MGIKDRIFDLVFPEWKRDRRKGSRKKGDAPSGRRADKPTDPEGYDSRYYIHRRR